MNSSLAEELYGCKHTVPFIRIFLMKHVVFDCDGTLIDTSGPKYKLFPGMKDLLTELAREHKLYVWTARGRSSTLRILEELGVAGLFEAFCTADDAPNKPHIAGLSILLGSSHRASICVIGDTSNDVLGAKNFGVLAIGAVWNSLHSGDVLKDAGADFIVSHPSECSKIIALNLVEDPDV
jgi:phosphoglycolate phosphatase-like HAD superfamily hydrolase